MRLFQISAPASFFCLAFILFSEVSSFSQTESQTAGVTADAYGFVSAGEYKIVEQEEIEKIFKHHGGKLLVVNYWSTFCAPCVQELPHFVEAYEKYKDQGVVFVGMSNDFISTADKTVPPFLKKMKIPYPNYVIYVDMQKYIPWCSPDWQGGLPATFFYDSRGNKLGEKLRMVEKEELFMEIEKFLKKSEIPE